MEQQILVVTAGGDAGSCVVAQLEQSGYDVVECDADCTDAAFRTGAPDLVVLDVGSSPNGASACVDDIRATLNSEATPLVVVAQQMTIEHRIATLRGGADDVLVEPFDRAELVERVRGVLRRTSEWRSRSPLTGLPGNRAIAAALRERIARTEPIAVVHVDISDFKIYNDTYGFLRGDRVITLCGDLMRKAAAAGGLTEAFIGHIGGDDFVAIIQAAAIEPFCTSLIEHWDRTIVDYYDSEHLSDGGIAVVDGDGRSKHYPLAHLAIGVATNLHRSFSTEWEASALAAEMREYAKRQPGSNFQVDRRER